MIFRKKSVPKSNKKKEIDVAQLWEVRWRSRYGEYFDDTKDEIEVFLSEKEAVEFKTSLTDAFGLLRHTSGTTVIVHKYKG